MMFSLKKKKHLLKESQVSTQFFVTWESVQVKRLWLINIMADEGVTVYIAVI